MYKVFLFFCLFQTFSLHAQEKIVIGIIPANSQDYSFNANEQTEITNAVTDAFVKTQRFTLVDRAHMNSLMQEKKLQKSEDFIDGRTVAQGRSLGAQYLISPVSSAYKNDGSVCKFNLQLTVIDVATGQITNSELIEVKGGGHGKRIAGAVGGAIVGRLAGVGAGTGAMLGASGKNDEKALAKALNDVGDEIDNFVSTNFPAYFSIVETTEKDKEGNPTKILISGGSTSGLSKGDRLKVVEISEIDVEGKKMTRKKDICSLKIVKVEDENFSSCAIISDDNSLSDMMEKKKKLKVVTVNE